MPHSSPRSPGQRPIPPARGALDMLAHKGAWCCPGCCPGFSPSCRGFGESDFVMKTPSTTPFACFRDRKLVPVVTSGSWAESPSVEAWGMGEGRKIDVAHGLSWLWWWSSACCRKCRADTVCTPQSLVLPRWSTPWTESEAYLFERFFWPLSPGLCRNGAAVGQWLAVVAEERKLPEVWLKTCYRSTVCSVLFRRLPPCLTEEKALQNKAPGRVPAARHDAG